jgi:hypothetical protein
MRRLIPILSLLLVVGMSGCFPGGGKQRTIVGDYRLHQWEDDTTYYLHKRGQDDSSQGGSIIGGTVLRIGWNSHYILAERHSIFRGDADGWMIIDVQSGAISGPFSDIDFRARPEAQGIQIYEVSEAWKRL